MDAANAQVLLSTTVNALRSELSTAWGVSADTGKKELIYYCARTGARTKIFNGTSEKTIMVQDYLKFDDSTNSNSQEKSDVDANRLKHSLVVRSGEKDLDKFQVRFNTVVVEKDIVTFEAVGVYRDQETTPVESIDLSVRILNPDFVVPELPTSS